MLASTGLRFSGRPVNANVSVGDKFGELRRYKIVDATSAEWLEGSSHASQPTLEYGESR